MARPALSLLNVTHCYSREELSTLDKSTPCLAAPMTQTVYNFVMYDGIDLSGLISDLKKQFGAHGALN